MTGFVVLLILLFALVLILAPYLLQVLAQNRDLREQVRSLQNDFADTLKTLEQYRMACEHASDGVLLQDMRGVILWCNRAYCNIHGVEREYAIGRNPLEFVMPPEDTPSPEEIAAFRYQPGLPEFEGLQTFRNKRANGELFWLQINLSFHKAADGLDYAILVCRDVTEQVEQEQNLRTIGAQLEHEATHDGLTGVANRAAFTTFVNRTIRQDPTRSLGLLHIDLDLFKVVNDTHGHSAGDAVLCHAAKVLADNIRKSDLVARIGGDEFVVVCPQSPDLSFLDEVARRLLTELSKPFRWQDKSLQVEASIGAAQGEGNIKDAEQLLAQADFALYEAKRAGRNRVGLYDQTLRAKRQAETQRASALAQAIETGAISYAYQPSVDLVTGEIAGVEVLARWHTDNDGVLPPADFLPLVEELGLMGQLDLLALRAALRKKQELDGLGLDGVRVAFNASPDLLGHPDFINQLIWGVDAAGVKRNEITIEVLENTNFGDVAESSSQATVIRSLRRLGFDVLLDDFGVGFAGLSHLAALEVSGVKLDRSLISNLLTDEVSAKVVQKTVELSNDLGLTVIAEGVEDDTTAARLFDMGCRLAQGYWLSPPRPEAEISEWVLNHNAGQWAKSA